MESDQTLTLFTLYTSVGPDDVLCMLHLSVYTVGVNKYWDFYTVIIAPGTPTLID